LWQIFLQPDRPFCHLTNKVLTDGNVPDSGQHDVMRDQDNVMVVWDALRSGFKAASLLLSIAPADIQSP